MAAASPSWANTPERIAAKAAPLLEEGEVVAHVIRGAEGPNRWLGMAIAVGVGLGLSLFIGLLGIAVMWVVYNGLYAKRVLLATDRALVVVGCGRWRYTPKVVLDRLDIETKIGPLKGLWLHTVLNGRRLYIAARSVRAVTAADKDVDQA
jgi:hypothetical protein